MRRTSRLWFMFCVKEQAWPCLNSSDSEVKLPAHSRGGTSYCDRRDIWGQNNWGRGRWCPGRWSRTEADWAPRSWTLPVLDCDPDNRTWKHRGQRIAVVCEEKVTVVWFQCSRSREESGKLRDELLFPAAGEVNRLPAALDVTANTRPLLFTAATCLKHGLHVYSE